MGAAPIVLCLPLGVHISDGVLSPPWLAAGFALAGLLALLAAYRVRDEEIPRIAILSAAFFIASLMHLRLGPTSVHLLLNGLVGVVLGRRAPLAILIGLGLQAALLGHGGFTTIGVNACVLTLPALLAGWMFAGLQRLPWTAGKRRALFWIFGCVIGMTSVLATLVLQAVVLLWGGAEDWHQIVWLVFYAHLPIVLLEGVVLGFTVSFLARVKPEMLALDDEALRKWDDREPQTSPAEELGIIPPATEVAPDRSADARGVQAPSPARPPALLLAVLTALWFANPACAHRLDASCQVLPDRQVRVESWFDLGGIPKGKVQVFRPGRLLLAEGELDEEGCFVFRFTEAEQLEVVVSAGAGHRVTRVIPREKLEPGTKAEIDADAVEQPRGAASAPGSRERGTPWQERFKDALIGISFLLALAAFILSWRCARKLKSLEQSKRPG